MRQNAFVYLWLNLSRSFSGAELREIQKQINHLENPLDPQEVRFING